MRIAPAAVLFVALAGAVLPASGCGLLSLFEDDDHSTTEEEEAASSPWSWDEGEEGSEEVGPEYSCDSSGLRRDGLLAVSVDQDEGATGLCTTSSWEPTLLGFDLCCDGFCCSYAKAQPKKKGQVCSASSQCEVGLQCVAAGVIQTCRYAWEGQPCSQEVWCEPGLFCSGGVVESRCVALGAKEGDPCSGEAQSCAFPLSCLCPEEEPCACYDGSTGDPCLSSTCQLGLYCAVFGDIQGANRCYEGDMGDPCALDWHCQSGFQCAEVTGEKKKECTAHLAEGDECHDQAEEKILCSPGLVCSTALEPHVCAKPSTDGELCAIDDDCAEGFVCLKGLDVAVGACWDGSAGDPCVGPDGCAEGLTCTVIAGETRCVQYLGWKDVCAPDQQPFTVCSPGLYCNLGYSPARCEMPGGVGTLCAADSDCVDGLVCGAAPSRCQAPPLSDPPS